MKQIIKQLFIPQGRKLRRLKGGVSKGMLMELDLVTQFQRYWGFNEREIMAPIQELISSCKSLVDVGANDGFYTMAFLQSSAERVVACEPDSTLDSLLSNARANGYEPGDRFRIERRPIGQGKECLGVAELIQNLPRPILLKVDIDGGEVELLHSAETCSFLPELRWVMETHSKELEEQCIDWLQSRGFQTRIIDKAPWRILLPENRPIPHNRWLIAEPTQS